MIVVVLVVVGLCLGSFVNALVWRLHERRNWVNERSECTHCRHQLAALDLIPVFSWLYLRGKCRYCNKPIQDTPLPELTVPILFVLSYYYWPLAFHGAGLFQFVLWLIFLVGFVALGLYDIRWYLLPDKVVFPFIGLAALQVLVVWLGYGGPWRAALGSVVGAAVVSGFFLLLFEVSKGKWIGFGDVKLGVVLGLLVGGAVHAFLLLFFASLLGVLISLPLVLAGKATRKTHLPFGPLLLAGAVVVVLFGSSLVDSYLRFVSG